MTRFASVNAVFLEINWCRCVRTLMLRKDRWLGGCFSMSKRLRAFLYGTEDAIPSDYVLALVATIGLMAAIFAGM